MRRLIDNGNRPITPKPHIGHYGRLRKAYLEQYRHRLYTARSVSSRWGYSFSLATRAV